MQVGQPVYPHETLGPAGVTNITPRAGFPAS